MFNLQKISPIIFSVALLSINNARAMQDNQAQKIVTTNPSIARVLALYTSDKDPELTIGQIDQLRTLRLSPKQKTTSPLAKKLVAKNKLVEKIREEFRLVAQEDELTVDEIMELACRLATFELRSGQNTPCSPLGQTETRAESE